MTSEEILAQLQGIFQDVFDDDGLVIERKTCADDIEDWDSLAQINLVVAIEKEFKAKFSLDDLITLNDVGDMVDLIARKVA
jgi:acyl carrier protein